MKSYFHHNLPDWRSPDAIDRAEYFYEDYDGACSECGSAIGRGGLRKDCRAMDKAEHLADLKQSGEDA